MTDTIDKNAIHGMMKSSYGDEKLDKSNELNYTMSIDKNKPADELTRKLESLGGNDGE